MKKLHLPFVNLPNEFITLLKSNLVINTSPAPIFDVIRPNRALMTILEKAFSEFDDGRGVEKVMLALGWSNFRERMASIYIYKAIYGNYPTKTDMGLVDELKLQEAKFLDHGVHSHSRFFLLAFYMQLAQIKLQEKENNRFLELKIPVDTILSILKLSQGRSERIDWLVLITMHLSHALTEKLVIHSLAGGKKFNDLYEMMSPDSKSNMHENLLAYGASIKEPELFLYEKI